ncbi:UDP-glucose 6-dehydrogenase [Penicillium argentinense]|uniref:UDP-glucose 6-dehydrogenase n=1 Tax=Penicillium argentinense TaxID=1131581 RepID=A0A9W9KE28_9EURO|nr:UDP-glucose 6-dehydrogenase [Penicillium argentinense]KAJ5102451.1 UDP-glucose 6-dehydrogenase [Penicillium argentinense]
MVQKITCIGAGFVGGPLGTVLAFCCPEISVTVVDKNAARIESWNSDDLPMYEPGLSDIIAQVRQRKDACNLSFSCEIRKAIVESDIIMLCIDTPTKNHGAGSGMALDLAHIQEAVRTIGEVATADKIIVEKSTVPGGTTSIIQDLLEAVSTGTYNFEVLSNPEFLSEGSAVNDLLHPSRVIIGCQRTTSGQLAAEKLAAVYRRWTPHELIITMNQWSAELSKLASNALLAQRISSINSLSAICEAVGADINSVAEACGTDPRIGNKMLQSGLGWGGSCFPKDVAALIYLARSLGLNSVADYWAVVLEMNEDQQSRFAKRILSCMHGCINGKLITILGFAFKQNTSDTKNSPSKNLARELLREGATIHIYDPMVSEAQIYRDVNASDEQSRRLRIFSTAGEACAGADAVVVATEWDQFKTPDICQAPYETNVAVGTNGMHTKDIQNNGAHHEHETGGIDWASIVDNMYRPAFIFDGRNILNAQYLESLGCRYVGIGHLSKWDRQHHGIFAMAPKLYGMI